MSDNIFNESPDGYSYASQELLNILDYVPSSDQDTYFDMSKLYFLIIRWGGT